MNKKSYKKPHMLVCPITSNDILAGSIIQPGQTDGNGSGQFPANSKESSLQWDTDEQ